MAGLVVPWLTHRDPDGRYRFGKVDADRLRQAISAALCQICGEALTRPIVFTMRDVDLKRGISPEPGMHPECARYAAASCPMLAGRMEHYRFAPPPTPDPLVELAVRLGIAEPRQQRQPAAAWFLTWASGYQQIIDPDAGNPAARLDARHILRIRPIPTASADPR